MIKWILYFVICTAVCNGREPSKISNGKRVTIWNYIYQVTLQQRNHHFCSGALITNDHILTTCSCILFEPHVSISNIRVIAGTADKYDSLGNGQVRNVRYIIAHKYYNPKELWIHDICILKLESSISLGRFHDRFKLANRMPPETVIFSCTGWGDKFVPIWEETKYLEKINMKNERHVICQNFFGKHLSIYQSCARTFTDQHITLGDGGNPVLYGAHIAGMVSVYIGKKSNLIVLTRVYMYRDWIKSIITKY